MTKSKSTKHALLCSVLATVLCAAMLVGTTFAWFTDSVTSGRNRIAAGNLDVELYHGDALDESVGEATDLFTNADGSAILWEPGVIAYENFKVANEGSLALKYQLSMNIVDYNTVDGKSLADVLKVAVLEGETFTGDRAAAQGLTYESALSDFVKEGNLLPEEADTYAVVIYWEPGANDNDYNLNNGKTSSDGEPLYIDLGITLTATQDTVESDSFDNQYDADAYADTLRAHRVEELVAQGYTAVDDIDDFQGMLADPEKEKIVFADDVVVTSETERLSLSQDKTIDFNNVTFTREDHTGNGLLIGEEGSDPHPVNVTIMNANFVSETTSAAVRVESGSTATFTDCTFTGSSPVQAYAQEGQKTTLVFENCTFAGEVDLGTASGGGREYDVVFRNCTFTGSFGNGGASVSLDSGAYGSVTLEDCDIDITYRGNAVRGINIGSYYGSNDNQEITVTLRNTNITLTKDPAASGGLYGPNPGDPVYINSKDITNLVIEDGCTFVRDGQTATYNAADQSWSYGA